MGPILCLVFCLAAAAADFYPFTPYNNIDVFHTVPKDWEFDVDREFNYWMNPALSLIHRYHNGPTPFSYQYRMQRFINNYYLNLQDIFERPIFVVTPSIEAPSTFSLFYLRSGLRSLNRFESFAWLQQYFRNPGLKGLVFYPNNLYNVRFFETPITNVILENGSRLSDFSVISGTKRIPYLFIAPEAVFDVMHFDSITKVSDFKVYSDVIEALPYFGYQYSNPHYSNSESSSHALLASQSHASSSAGAQAGGYSGSNQGSFAGSQSESIANAQAASASRTQSIGALGNMAGAQSQGLVADFSRGIIGSQAGGQALANSARFVGGLSGGLTGDYSQGAAGMLAGGMAGGYSRDMVNAQSGSYVKSGAQSAVENRMDDAKYDDNNMESLSGVYSVMKANSLANAQTSSLSKGSYLSSSGVKSSSIAGTHSGSISTVNDGSIAGGLHGSISSVGEGSFKSGLTGSLSKADLLSESGSVSKSSAAAGASSASLSSSDSSSSSLSKSSSYSKSSSSSSSSSSNLSASNTMALSSGGSIANSLSHSSALSGVEAASLASENSMSLAKSQSQSVAGSSSVTGAEPSIFNIGITGKANLGKLLSVADPTAHA